jgi:exocyst complex component 2
MLIVTRKWEEVDHEFDESIGTSLLEQSTLVERERETDPLGLPHSVEYILLPSLSQSVLNFEHSIKEMNVETSTRTTHLAYNLLTLIFFRTGSAVLITSKKFDSAAYLSTVHPDATYHDLAIGTANLQNAIEARAEALRILVEDHFDKFTSVKATIEGIPSHRFLRPSYNNSL